MHTPMMEKQNCYLTNLFLTGSTTSGLTKDSRAPRSPAIILFVFCCQKKKKDVLLLAPKSMSTSTGNCSSGGAKATYRRQVTKRISKANSVTLLSEKRSLSKMTPEVNLLSMPFFVFEDTSLVELVDRSSGIARSKFTAISFTLASICEVVDR